MLFNLIVEYDKILKWLEVNDLVFGYFLWLFEFKILNGDFF